MISLKKNDKIIIIAAVVILVIAGAAIAMYQSPKSKDYVPPNITGEEEYSITWTARNGTLDPISEFVQKKSVYEGTVQIPEGNVKSITFNLSWTDDRMTFLKRMGLDSLTLEVTMLDGFTFTETGKSAPKTGEGTITHTEIREIIPPKSLKASDDKTAKDKLKEKPYYDDSWSNKDISINISVQIGEIRILKKFRDKGNDFELKISYEYLDGALQGETKNTGEELPPPPDDDDRWEEAPPYLSMMINTVIKTGCGRYI